MKPSPPLIIVFTYLLFVSCSKYPVNFLKEKSKLIAIQPVGDFDTVQSKFIRDEISHFYNRPVIVLRPIAIPPGYIVSQGEDVYAADSILNLLSALINDTIIEVVGLTHVDICTLKGQQATKDQPVTYGFKGIFGIGHLPGKVCLISDHRLKDPDPLVLQHRMKTVTLHEMGHNLGLAHCPVTQCLMSDTNGKTYILDRNENYYCDKCKSKLK